MTLARRTALLSVLVLVPSLILGALALRTSLNFMETAAFDTVDVQAIVASKDVEAWLRTSEERAQEAAADSSIVDLVTNTVAEKRVNSQTLMAEADRLGLRSAKIYDQTGLIIAETSGAPRIPDQFIELARGRDSYFGTARRVERGDERLTVLVPVGNETIQTGAILAAELSIEDLDAVLPTETPWDSGEVAVVQIDAEMRLLPITPLRFTEDAEFSSTEAIEGLTTSSDDLFVATDYRGVDTVGGLDAIDGSQWYVLVKADTDDVMVAPQRVRLLWLIASLLALGWTALVVTAATRRYQRRLQKLTGMVDELALGDTYDPVPADGNDEVGRLAKAIDQMRENNLAEHDRRAEVERELRHQARHDVLTGQLNRGRFMELLSNRIESVGGQSSAVLFCDLDNFKSINDRYGHNAGDLLLTKIADRFASQLMPGEYLARYGGDEFVLLCSSEGDRAEQLRDDLTRALRDTVELEGMPVLVEGSIGIASGHLNDDPSEFVRRADLAMYEVKKGRKNAMLPGVGERRRVDYGDDELSMAIEENELRLLYQPIIGLETGRISGVEGLVRWRHPQYGLLDPSGIIARADRSGLLDRVDRWVFEQACRQLKAWMVSRTIDDSFSMSVNLSPPLLTDPTLVDDLDRLLNIYDIDPAMMQIEITEHGLGGVEDQVMRSLDGIKKLGVRIAIDDFGTLHSNLDRLRQFEADALKIDKSFVSGSEWSQESQAILSAVLSVAQALGVTTIAEGIETIGERRVLTDLGCTYGQGFFFGPPRSAELTAQLLSMSQHRTSWPA